MKINLRMFPFLTSKWYRVGYYRFSLVLISIIASSSITYAQDSGQINLNFENEELSSALVKVEKVSGKKMIFSTEDVKGYTVTGHVNQQDITKALDVILTGKPFTFKVQGNFVTLTKTTVTNNTKVDQGTANTRIVYGTVLDEENNPLIAVNIHCKGTNISTYTDINGSYSINIPLNSQILEFSYVGMHNVEVIVKPGKANQKLENITLRENIETLKEVVITGYQTISRERATGSYSILTADDITNKTETDLMSRIEGLVPGINNSGETRYNDVIIRGRSTVKGETQVLYIVDGIPYEGNTDPYLGDAINPLKMINPNDIANITVLKDAAATSIYGARAANGVIVITTHKGKKGKAKVTYSGAVRFSSAPSTSSYNLINSSQLVDYFQTVYNTVTPDGYSYKNTFNTSWDERKFRDPVYDALVANDNGTINANELRERLDYYSSLNNRDQIYDALSRTAVTHHHTLSVSGGSDTYRYYLSGNFINNDDHDKFSSSKQYGITAKNDFNISSKLSAYINLTANTNSSKRTNYNTASYSGLLMGYPSYYMLKDENGNLLNFPNGRGSSNKSAKELDDLINKGLLDEYYYPTQDTKLNDRSLSTNYLRFQGGLNWKIIDGLSASATYQTEIVNSKEKEYFLEESYYMRSHINDAAQISEDGVVTYNIPIGGRLNERRSDQRSFTLRAQLDYNKTFNNDHTITALAGAERRETKNTSSNKVLIGYSENGMKYVLPDSKFKTTIYPTEGLDGYYYDSSLFDQGVGDSQNRFVSFYGNASYSYCQRYDISASIRMDETNLFGRKSNNKWKPIWSTGVSWNIANEAFMETTNWIDLLKLRLTYGIGGNFARSSGVYATIYSVSNDSYTNLYPLAYIREPKNEKLTWEKTATTNIGVDFSILKTRLSGSLDYYQKRTTDMLGSKSSDPTLGWQTVSINYGDMDNKGLEFTLNGKIIDNRNFKWNGTLTFSYNKNKIRNFEVAQTVADFLYNDVLELGKPLGSVYSTRYAGLDEKGAPLFYNLDDEKVAYSSLTKEDLVYSGTTMPKYTSALISSFSVKNFNFSFKLMYYGGNVFRDQSISALTGLESTNFNKESLNFWREPGDEMDLSKSPALNPTSQGRWSLGWLSRDTNIKKRHYIKLRNVNFSYTVPKTILDMIKIENIVLSFQADNLLWWASNGNIDPETVYMNQQYFHKSMRTKPTFSFGVNINF